MATRARSDFLDGAIVPMAAMADPIEPGLENPHSAYVAIVSDRFEIVPALMYSDNLA